MPTLLPVETRIVTRKLTVKQAISDMQLRYHGGMIRQASQSRNGVSIPSLEEIRNNILPDMLSVEYLNYAIEIVAQRGEKKTYSASFTQTSFSQDTFGGWSMAWPTAAYRIDEVLYRTGTDQGKVLEGGVISIDELESREPNWRNAGTSTPPRYAVIWGRDRVGLYPKPSDATYTVDLIGIGKPSVVGFDTGSVTSAALPTTVNDTTKRWFVNQWVNAIVEFPKYRTTGPYPEDIVVSNLATSFETTTSYSTLAAGDLYRIDNVLPIPDEYHGIVIDTATNIALLGGVMAAEEMLIKSRAWYRLRRDSMESMYVEPRGYLSGNRR